MEFIDPNLAKIVTARDEHYAELNTKITGIINKQVRSGDFKDFLIANLKNILIGEPNLLRFLHLYMINRINTNNIAIDSIFSYKNFSNKDKKEYNIYDLATKLDINTCVYCNRIYTKTVSRKNKITRPTFDHWFPKKSYPLLALSFFNLIPSCNVCNSGIKGKKIFSLSSNYHPYIPETINYSYSYQYDKTISNYNFAIKPRDKKSRNYVDLFKLAEIYETHIDEIEDLLKIKLNYSTSYLTSLKSILNQNIGDDEIYRLAFGTHYNSKDFSKRPLSRMKKDILIELGILSI